MRTSELIGKMVIVLIFLMFFALISVCIYNEANMEYKYTAEVNCYDRHDSMIENMTCKHEVYCGPWQESTPFRDGRLPCEELIEDSNVIELNDVKGEVTE